MAEAVAYVPQTPLEKHLAELLEQLPAMEELQRKLATHKAAAQLCAKHEGIEDLEDALEILAERGAAPTPEGEFLHERLVGEKTRALELEQARLNHDLTHSPFGTMAAAVRALLPQEEVRIYEEQLERFRCDYAYTYDRCRRA